MSAFSHQCTSSSGEIICVMLIQFAAIPKGLYSASEQMNFLQTWQITAIWQAFTHINMHTFTLHAQLNASPLMCSTDVLHSVWRWASVCVCVEEKYINNNQTKGDYSHSFLFYFSRGTLVPNQHCDLITKHHCLPNRCGWVHHSLRLSQMYSKWCLYDAFKGISLVEVPFPTENCSICYVICQCPKVVLWQCLVMSSFNLSLLLLGCLLPLLTTAFMNWWKIRGIKKKIKKMIIIINLVSSSGSCQQFYSYFFYNSGQWFLGRWWISLAAILQNTTWQNCGQARAFLQCVYVYIYLQSNCDKLV